MGENGSPQTNRDVLHKLNKNNGISEEVRAATIELFLNSGATGLKGTIERYLLSMDQDRRSQWLRQRPQSPIVAHGPLPRSPELHVESIGIGGMFAYLNVLYHAFKRGGSHCIVTHPHDIWTFSGWTVHPEEDMDQRLIAMYRTATLMAHEARTWAGRREDPRSIRFKSFKIDYAMAARMLKTDPREFTKLFKVNLDYVRYEIADRQNRWARTNLRRNAQTLAAFREMGRVGEDPDRDFVNLQGRVVFEVEKEKRIPAKERLKEEFGLQGRRLTSPEVTAYFGCRTEMIREIEAGEIRPVLYPGGYFYAGFKDNALRSAEELGIRVFREAEVTEIRADPGAERWAIRIRTGAGEEKWITSDAILMALGDYGQGVMSVDGVSTLFAIRTDRKEYRIQASGMGEGGNIHLVPVCSAQRREGRKTYFYHLGKGTDGAIVGRHPYAIKSLGRDKAFLFHLEAHVKRLMPEGGQLIWLAATECGRPVSAKQGYSVRPLLPRHKVHSPFPPGAASHLPRSFVATGGCGLGGNTAIIPEVQELLDRLRKEKASSF